MMSDTGLEKALSRLEAAIDRLDAVALERKNRVETPPATSPGNSASGGNDGELQDELKALKKDYAALAGVTQSVATRLDLAVERLEESLD